MVAAPSSVAKLMHALRGWSGIRFRSSALKTLPAVSPSKAVPARTWQSAAAGIGGWPWLAGTFWCWDCTYMMGQVGHGPSPTPCVIAGRPQTCQHETSRKEAAPSPGQVRLRQQLAERFKRAPRQAPGKSTSSRIFQTEWLNSGKPSAKSCLGGCHQ